MKIAETFENESDRHDEKRKRYKRYESEQRIEDEHNDRKDRDLHHVHEEVRNSVAEERVDRLRVAVYLTHKSAGLTSREKSEGQALYRSEYRLSEVVGHHCGDLRRQHTVHHIKQRRKRAHAHHEGYDKSELTVERSVCLEHLVVEECGADIRRDNAEHAYHEKTGERKCDLRLVFEKEHGQAAHQLSLVRTVRADLQFGIGIARTALRAEETLRRILLVKLDPLALFYLDDILCEHLRLKLRSVSKDGNQHLPLRLL